MSRIVEGLSSRLSRESLGLFASSVICSTVTGFICGLDWGFIEKDGHSGIAIAALSAPLIALYGGGGILFQDAALHPELPETIDNTPE